MATNPKPTSSLRIKCTPVHRASIGSLRDQRPWELDVYGATDDFSRPISGNYGPIKITYSDGELGDNLPSLIPVLGRNQFYNTDTALWERLKGTANGLDVVTSLVPDPIVFAGQITDSRGPIAISSSLSTLVSNQLNKSVSLIVSADSGVVWLSWGSPAVVGKGYRLTPTAPFTYNYPLSMPDQLFGIAETGTVNVGVLAVYEA